MVLSKTLVKPNEEEKSIIKISNENMNIEEIKFGMTVADFKSIYDIESSRFIVEYNEGLRVFDEEKEIRYDFSSSKDYGDLYQITTSNAKHEVFGIKVNDSINDTQQRLMELNFVDKKSNTFYELGDIGVQYNIDYLKGDSSYEGKNVISITVRLFFKYE